jgi:hypothetical protein
VTVGVLRVTRRTDRAGTRPRIGAAGTLTALAAAVLAAAVLPVGTAASAGTGAPGRAAAAAGVISTVAGGAGGPARGADVGLPGACGVSSGGGQLYVGDAYSVRAVSGTGRLTTVAGTGVPAGPLGDRGPAVKATFNGVCGVTVDQSGNLVAADARHDRIRVLATRRGTFYGQLMTAGHIYTVAGSGGYGFGGDGGPATAATLDKPGAVTVDAAGNLVIADSYNWRVRVVAEKTGTFYGQPMTTGDIYTVAGGGGSPLSGVPARTALLRILFGVAVDQAGNLVIADTSHYQIRVVAEHTGTLYGRRMIAGDIYTVAGTGRFGDTGDGGPALDATFDAPHAVQVDRSGNLVIADAFNDKIRVVAEHTGTFYGQAMTAGDIYTVAGTGTGGYSGDGGPATSAELRVPTAAAFDGAGNLLIADSFNQRIRVVAEHTGTFYGRAMTAGDIYTVAGNGDYAYSGDGGPATSAELNSPRGLAVSGTGNLFIADGYNNRIRMVAASTGTFYGQQMTAGHMYTVAGDGGPGGLSGDGGRATRAQLDFPANVALVGPDNLLIADVINNRIRMVAASTGTFFGQAMTAGHIYTVAGSTGGFSGDGGPATRAQLSECWGVAADAAGNLVIADTSNARVRVVAASTGTFYGRAMTAGDIYTVAGDGDSGFSGDGGPATMASLVPISVTVDGAGNLVIADTGNDRVRVVAERTGTFYGRAMTAGDIYTVAGNGTTGYSGDGGPATSAEFDGPLGVAVDAAGNLLIGDLRNNRVRAVAEHTGTFYGQAMTAGDIYTVAGNGHKGFSRDGAPATSAEINFPFGVAAGSAGSLLIGDSGSNRVRLVTG